MMPEIGGKIKKLRVRYGMNRSQFAEVIGKRSETVALYEENKLLPDFGTLLEISEMFDISLLSLMDLEDTLREISSDAECAEVSRILGISREDVNDLRENRTDTAVLLQIYLTLCSENQD